MKAFYHFTEKTECLIAKYIEDSYYPSPKNEVDTSFTIFDGNHFLEDFYKTLDYESKQSKNQYILDRLKFALKVFVYKTLGKSRENFLSFIKNNKYPDNRYEIYLNVYSNCYVNVPKTYRIGFFKDDKIHLDYREIENVIFKIIYEELEYIRISVNSFPRNEISLLIDHNTILASYPKLLTKKDYLFYKGYYPILIREELMKVLEHNRSIDNVTKDIVKRAISSRFFDLVKFVYTNNNNKICIMTYSRMKKGESTFSECEDIHHLKLLDV